MKENRLRLIMVTTEYNAASAVVKASPEKESLCVGMNGWNVSFRSQSSGASRAEIPVRDLGENRIWSILFVW